MQLPRDRVRPNPGGLVPESKLLRRQRETRHRSRPSGPSGPGILGSWCLILGSVYPRKKKGLDDPLVTSRFCFVFIIWWKAPSNPSQFCYERAFCATWTNCSLQILQARVWSFLHTFDFCPYHLFSPGPGPPFDLLPMAIGDLESRLGFFRVPSYFFLAGLPSIVSLYFTSGCLQMLWILRPLR